MCANVSSDAPISVNTNGITLNNAAGTHTQGLEQYISIKDGIYTAAAKTDSSIWIRTFTYSNKTITNISRQSVEELSTVLPLKVAERLYNSLRENKNDTEPE